MSERNVCDRQVGGEAAGALVRGQIPKRCLGSATFVTATAGHEPAAFSGAKRAEWLDAEEHEKSRSIRIPRCGQFGKLIRKLGRKLRTIK